MQYFSLYVQFLEASARLYPISVDYAQTVAVQADMIEQANIALAAGDRATAALYANLAIAFGLHAQELAGQYNAIQLEIRQIVEQMRLLYLALGLNSLPLVPAPPDGVYPPVGNLPPDVI